MKKRQLIMLGLIFAGLALCVNASTSDEMLTALVEKTRDESATEGAIRDLRDKLNGQYPNTDQAAIGESIYLWHLAESPKPRKFDEIKGIFRRLRLKGESKWYVVSARLGLTTAYTYEDRLAEAKALAQEGLQLINVSDLKQSYNTLLPMLKLSLGDEGFENADADMGKWMTALQEVANH